MPNVLHSSTPSEKQRPESCEAESCVFFHRGVDSLLIPLFIHCGFRVQLSDRRQWYSVLLSCFKVTGLRSGTTAELQASSC